ncbi:PucR family transcriptional regulator [Saccharothrix sp. ST-888]|uniref:PucR family transcriptional regulator n=1 Tax=Saccharothrix sp. ST-888 TaxID=1427391 RepID=UPI0005ED34EB|nr:PucR family transcriptional regulator [Saccharothrix sp. ST-888]
MIVGDLLELDDLHIGLAWGTSDLLGRQVTGVTSTDLQDPARYLQPGELVLSGLVWWRPDQTTAALRFATSLRSAGVAGLLAGEGTHGSVPESLVEACRTHGIPLLSVPPGTSFRAVTDRVYLRLWGDLQTRSHGVAAIPEAARRELLGLLHTGTRLDEVLACAVARLGLPDCSVVTASGRVIASSTAGGGAGTASRGSVPIGPQGDSPFDGWLLQPHTVPEPWAAGLLPGLAELLTPLATRARATAAAQRQTAARAAELVAQDGPEPELLDTLAACGLPPGAALVPVTVRLDGGTEEPWAAAWAVSALAEALHRLGAPFAAGTDGRGGAVGLVAAPATEVTAGLRSAWPALQSRLTGRRWLRAGVGPATTPAGEQLRGALIQAAYAQDAGAATGGTGTSDTSGTSGTSGNGASGTGRSGNSTGNGKAGTGDTATIPRSGAAAVGSSGELGSLADLLRGVPVEVTAAFHRRLLAPVVEHDRENTVSLLGTLNTFLDHDGSWARTAEALHLHVNTVHYRIRRIEELTGRSLARLEDRIDLRAALLCAPPAR